MDNERDIEQWFGPEPESIIEHDLWQQIENRVRAADILLTIRCTAGVWTVETCRGCSKTAAAGSGTGTANTMAAAIVAALDSFDDRGPTWR